MKFELQFENNRILFLLPNSWQKSRDFGFRALKPPRKFGGKDDLIQKEFQYGVKYFMWLYILRYGTLISTSSLLAAMSFFFVFPAFFFPCFVFLNLVRYLLNLNNKTSKYDLACSC